MSSKKGLIPCMLYGLDNLAVLDGIDDNTIDLVYLDPPFNKNQQFNAPLTGKAKQDLSAFIGWFNAFNAQNDHKLSDELLKWKADFLRPNFKDTWASNVDLRNMDGWLAELQEHHPEAYILLESLDKLSAKRRHYKAHLSYLAFMTVRLVHIRRILKPTGSVYLHCDPTMSHWLKVLMDTLFGEKNFRNEITWQRTGSHNNTSGRYGKVTDRILYYTKTDKYKLAIPAMSLSQEEASATFTYMEKETGRRYTRGSLDVTSASSSKGDIRMIQGRRVVANCGWKWTQETFDRRLKKHPDLIHWSKAGRPYYKVYEDEYKGMSVNDLWIDIRKLSPTANERVGYPTQKPLALLERIIAASTNEGDLVLDPFCGCATTCIAAHKLNRCYVGVDISKASYILNLYRLYKEIWGWTKDGMFNGEGIGRYASHTPRYTERAPERLQGPLPEAGYVYIIYNKAWPGQYKVGIAKDPERRLRGYNTGGAFRDYELKGSFLCMNHREVEKAVHRQFPSAHEWVSADLADIKDFIAQACVKEEASIKGVQS